MRQVAAKADSGAPAFEMRSDREILHADLARANLLRLRGDFEDAEKLCVKVLEAEPESAAAHTLLGDIALAQGHADQAVEHFEIAQSLEPLAPDIGGKLSEARDRQHVREAESTAEQLGLPRRKWLWWQLALVGGACMVLLFVGGIFAMRADARSAVTANPVSIMATPDTIANRAKTKPRSSSAKPSTAPVGVSASTATAEPAAPSVSVSAGASNADRGLGQAISQHSSMGSHLLNVISDPRARNVTVTYFVAAGEDPRPVGAELAKATLERAGDALGVTIRALRDGELIYMADVSRVRYDETLTEGWQRANSGDDAWIAFCLSNEWPIRESETGGAPDGATTAGASAGPKPP